MIRDIEEKNNKISIKSIREEKLDYILSKFTDTNGNFDLENFRKYLEEKDVNIIREGYSLNFLGKRAAELQSALDSTTVFVPDIEHNSKPENKDSKNIYISADNLEALRHLKKSYHNKIKCIYIDPPYNTGKDGFCYTDKFKYDKDDLAKKLGIDVTEAERILNMESIKSNSHSAWLSFMYARLLIARSLLSDDGIIFISIDDNEQANLKLLCDDIFGEDNLVLNIVVNRASEIASSISIQKHEYMLCYSRNKEVYQVRENIRNRYVVSRGTVGNENQTQPVIKFPAGLKCYGIEDGIYKKTRKIMNSKENIENLDDIIVENGILMKPVRLKARWRSSQDMRNFFNNNCLPTKAKISGVIEEIYFENDKFIPQIKKSTASKISSLVLNNNKGSSYLEDLNMDNCFDFPKSVELIKEILKMSNNLDNMIFLDFFSGSGTSAQAIYEIIKDSFMENGTISNIKFIMIQINDKIILSSNNNTPQKQIELCDSINKPHTLDWIGIERIKRAAKKIKDETNADIDYGFKHYTLVDKKDTLDMLEKFESTFAVLSRDEILNEFSLESRLITFLCDDGFGLNAKYQEIDIAGYKGYLIEGFLYLLDIGFDSSQIANLIEKIDKKEIILRKIIIFGYAFDTRSLQQLKDNAEKLGVNDNKDIMVKY